MINFEETELRLGLPGDNGGGGGGGGGGYHKSSDQLVEIMKSCGKRGFSETVDLKLNLSTKESSSSSSGLLDHQVVAVEKMKEIKSSVATKTSDHAKPPAK